MTRPFEVLEALGEVRLALVQQLRRAVLRLLHFPHLRSSKQWSLQVSFPPSFEGHVTKFAPRKAQKLIV